MKNYLLLLSILVFMVACASPQKSFKKGNYEKAYNAALKNLEKGKSDRKDKQVLNKSFNELVKKYQYSNSDLMTSNHIEDWELAYEEGNVLIETYRKGKRYLDSDFDTTMEKFMDDNVTLKNDIATNYWSIAEESMAIYDETGDKTSAQEAFNMYRKVEEYGERNQFPNLNVLMNEALESGTIYILVEADSWEFSQQWEIDQQFDDIERENVGYFTKIFFEENVDNPDCHIEVDFGSLGFDESVNRNNQSFSERIVDGYETVTDTSGNSTQKPIYKNVSGTVVINQIERRYDWSARVRINRNSNYCDLRNRTFDARLIDTREEYQLSGDDRAIPDRYKSNNGEDFTYSEREAAEELIEEIYEDFRQYYFR